MRFGNFDDAAREYVITTPKTPFPWINYLGTDRFFGLISNTAGGYTFYRDARLRRLTRYRYNNVPIDNGGRYFYIHDSGDFWSPGWSPVKRDLDSYECRHGLGYTAITGSRTGIKAQALFFVPLDFDGEIHRVTLTNTTKKQKNITLFSFLEFCLYNAHDDSTNFQRNLNIGEVEIDGSTIYHKTEYRERRNHYTFYTVNRPLDGFDTSRESFTGLYDGFDNPQVVRSAKPTNSVADGWAPVASHCLKVSLDPGESKDFVFMFGYVENDENDKWEAKNVINKKKARDMINRFATIAQVDEAFAALRASWDGLLSRYTIKSPEQNLDRMVNIWNQYQCMVTFNLSRSASYFESGIGRGMGFRDSNQDILGFVHQIPARARERILDLASTQFEDGGAFHQYQPLTKKGNFEMGGNFNDDPLWMVLSTASYIKETGDFTVLDEVVPFECDPNKTGSVYEHVKRSFYHVVNNRGPHGLPLIGRADWNDCLNLNCFSTVPDESFQTVTNKEGKTAESVLIAGMFVFIGREFVEICKRTGRDAEAQQAQAHIDDMEKIVMKHGWDGEWFLRAYDNASSKVGSKECDEGKIFIEPQGFCVMAKIGVADGSAQKALDSAKKYLDTPYGMVLQNPAYTSYRLNLGEISSYPPGYKENAGIFCHNNPWIMIAETVLGRGDRAFECYSKIAPAFIEDISEIHRMEPYVYSQMIAGKDGRHHGEAKNSWLTGTAAWNFIAISQWILGIRAYYDGLVVDPCIPQKWDGFSVDRFFRNATYSIIVKNPSHVCKGVKSIVVDGKKIEGNCVPVFGDGKRHEVEVVMG